MAEKDLELVVEQTILPDNLRIIKEARGRDIWYVFDKPIFLPYDRDLAPKVEGGAKISTDYFTEVLRSFIENAIPTVFPKGFYDTMEIDSKPYRININPSNHGDHQHSFNLYFEKNITTDQPNTPQGHKNTHTKTSVFLTSTIFHP